MAPTSRPTEDSADNATDRAISGARLELSSGDAASAAARCRAALQLAPGRVALWNVLGEALLATAPDEAEAAWHRALQIESTNPEARFHLGNLLRNRGEPHAAVAQYERALESAPSQSGLLNNLGLALQTIGERERAEACFAAALASNPQYAEALGNIASVRFEREAYADAVSAYDRLFAIRHDVPAAIWARYAIAQQEMGALDAAERGFRQATQGAPDDARTHANLGTLLVEARRYADAEPFLLRAFELEPRNAYVLSMLAHTRQQRCAWDALTPMFDDINRLLESDIGGTSGNINPFTVLSMPSSPRAQLHAAQRWAAGLAPAAPLPRPGIMRTAGERLRVGFVSSDFREHAIARTTVELFERLDRTRLETFGYGLRPRDPSPFGERIAHALEHFADVSRRATAAIAQRIRADRIAILVDMNGYTVHDRARLYTLRAAPIQVSWLGYLGTLGADWIDHVLTDGFATPAELKPYFSERFLHLPGCLFPGDSRREIAAESPSRSDSGLPPDAFVFCCFNNQYKILPPVFATWMRLLQRVPGSVLWLSPADADAIDNLRHEARKGGTDPERLVFAPRVPLPQHLARHRHADLFLDTFPYNAGATANDALWMGVPVVTCAGETMVSRIAGSQLHALHIPELVTSTLADYETLAWRLATKRDELHALRARLAATRRTAPLFDTGRFARGLEETLLRLAADDAA